MDDLLVFVDGEVVVVGGDFGFGDEEGLGGAGAGSFGGEVLEAGEDVGDVGGREGGASVVEGEAVGLHVVEPDVVGAAVVGLGEEEDGGGDAGVGLEDAGGHGDDGLEAVGFDEFAADGLVGAGGAEEDAVGDDAGTAAADFEDSQEKGEEKELCLFGVADAEEVGGDDVGVEAALERRIGEDERVAVAVGVLVGEGVAVFDGGVFDAVDHHVHGADAEHGAVGVVAVEHGVHVVGAGGAVEEDVGLAVLAEPVAGGDEEAGGAAGGVADGVVGAGLRQGDHHADDVARSAELAVDAGGGDFGEEVFVDVAADVGGFEAGHAGVEVVHGGDDLVEEQGGGNFEDGVGHVAGVGALAVAVEILDERKDGVLDGGVHLGGREVAEDAPLEHVGVGGAGEEGLVGEAEHGGLAGAEGVGLVEVVDEHQVGHLFDDVQRVGEAAGPEDFPEGVDFVLEFAGDHACRSLSAESLAAARGKGQANNAR